MSWGSKIKDHYERNWAAIASSCAFSAGPVEELPPDFSVLKFASNANRSMWTYATCCMSQPTDSTPLELHMFSPLETDEIVELLYVTAHYHRTGARLDLGHSVNFGRPWLVGATASYGLVSLPYLDGPDLEFGHIDEKRVRCLWLIPVTRNEVEFKKLHGLEALERRFDEVGLNYLERQRDSVA